MNNQKEIENSNTIKDSEEIKKESEVKKPLYTVQAFSDIEMVDIPFLWFPYIPEGKFTLLAGDPGCGKTFVTSYIASVVSNGGNFIFENERVKQGNILILNSEDSPTILKKRLVSLNANTNNIFCVDSEKYFLKISNVKTLEEIITKNNISLLIIDPLNSFLGTVDSSNDVSFRKAVEPLLILAEKHNVTVIGVCHLNKGSNKSDYRINGSIGYLGVPRSVLFVVKDFTDENRRIFCQQKNSYSDKGDAITFNIDDNRVIWGHKIDEFNLDEYTSSEKFSYLKEAKDTILFILKETDKIEAKAFENKVCKEGISARTFERARSNLKKEKIIDFEKKDGKTYWFLINDSHIESKNVEQEAHNNEIYDDDDLPF